MNHISDTIDYASGSHGDHRWYLTGTTDESGKLLLKLTVWSNETDSLVETRQSVIHYVPDTTIEHLSPSAFDEVLKKHFVEEIAIPFKYDDPQDFEHWWFMGVDGIGSLKASVLMDILPEGKRIQTLANVTVTNAKIIIKRFEDEAIERGFNAKLHYTELRELVYTAQAAIVGALDSIE